MTTSQKRIPRNAIPPLNQLLGEMESAYGHPVDVQENWDPRPSASQLHAVMQTCADLYGYDKTELLLRTHKADLADCKRLCIAILYYVCRFRAKEIGEALGGLNHKSTHYHYRSHPGILKSSARYRRNFDTATRYLALAGHIPYFNL